MNCSYCHTKKGLAKWKCPCTLVRWCSQKCKQQDWAHTNSCSGPPPLPTLPALPTGLDLPMAYPGGGKKNAAASSGTGYGGDGRGDLQKRKAGIKQAVKRENQALKEWQKELSAFVKKKHGAGEDASSILDTLKKVLRSQTPDWWWIQPQRSLYVTALQVCNVLTQHYPREWGEAEDEESAMAALEELSQTSKLLIKQLEKEDSTKDLAAASTTKGVVDLEESPKISPSWFSSQLSSKKTHDKDSSLPKAVVQIREQAAAVVASVVEAPELSMTSAKDRQVLKPHAFETAEAFERPKHFYAAGGGHSKQPDYLYQPYNYLKKKATPTKNGNKKNGLNGIKASAAVLWKEISTYPTALPIEYGSSIFVRSLENQMDMLRALIIGPEDTPYSNGIFMFDISMGDYPHSPPKVQFLTTSSFLSAGAKKVRFNPNLYECGKVCLSLLGTWQGPGWQKGESTLLQVLVSLQSLILGTSEPYFNEPGFQSSQGTARGKTESDKYNKKIRRYTFEVAILPFLKNQLQSANKHNTTTTAKRKDPPGTGATNNKDAIYFPEFAEVIEQHFRLKKQAIQKQLWGWLQEDATLQNLYTEYWNTVEQLEQETTTQSAAAANAKKRARRSKVDAPAVKMQDGVILLDDDDDDDGFEAATALAIKMSVEGLKSDKKPGEKDEVVMLDDSEDEEDCKPSAKPVAKPSANPAAKRSPAPAAKVGEGQEKVDASGDVVDLT
ncbi:(E3-independent) E2 ubiquitin-conjugating enzyme UBE2O [Seminavis robusta]|uniref:(E3-independent) E2 ubiquitin-conjugating enzyme UBE2O n=1 Tax=Seminavis robusta TaxID=568900 RepID=A0A9N8HGL0_9STRA|nr:(E3-independent) E2 ubiquitin-conjugating enzyme UBE2O [Seminavis robusta]|eukprot:Sro514_g158110.1 (E3-independent) E2 ubiquitin-conjugating enzyme UBE2O (724) ;mRNA; r:41469-43815